MSETLSQLNLKLVPFDKSFAPYLLKFYIEPEYAHFSRTVGRYLSLEEVIHLPEILGAEVLGIVSGENLIGLVVISKEPWDVYFVGIAIDTKFQKQGLAYLTWQRIEEYIFNKRGGRILMLEILSDDEAYYANAFKKVGYIYSGSMPEYTFIDGKYADVKFFYKKNNLLNSREPYVKPIR